MKDRMVKYSSVKQASRLRGVLCSLAVLSLCVLPVAAQNVPIIVNAQQQINDQLNKHLKPGDMVQILFYNGQIYPPGIDGTPNTNNPVAYEVRIGHGVINHTSTVGRFNAAITKRSEAQIFARAWNTPSLANASYYGDSQVFTPQQGKVFYPVIESTSNALDLADSDGDGLNNSMENDFGSNPNNVDSDGDGVSDMDEFRSGTKLTDEDSYLAMVDLLPDGIEEEVVLVQWSSVDGYSYQLQYAVEELNATNLAFYNINSVVTATSEVSYTFVTNNLFEEIKTFRVLLVE